MHDHNATDANPYAGGPVASHYAVDELVAAVNGASNRLIDVEALSEKELVSLHRHYAELVKLARADADVTQSHSVEEAKNRHALKTGGRS